MIGRAFASLGAATGLAIAPLTADAQLLLLPACGGGAHLLVVPGDPAAPGGKGDQCAKACHAVTDRRTKAKDGKRGGCC
ncbi:hypothetical protein KNJ79_15700 [Sphingopyxis indica]|uniref:hypothetical protein n=1 Tax=Sphingopyxis indica TaxID=436663 RepID=UPI00293912A3|nr:hypothetical protein [Sphingopyxis indica]WOF42603.1 hypothetical protein KNJ79_15700 [Sphingopyxis indica]